MMRQWRLRGRKISTQGFGFRLDRRGFLGFGAGVDPSRLVAIPDLLLNHNKPSTRDAAFPRRY
jgi:hypothetical protein